MYPCYPVYRPETSSATCPHNILYSKRSNWISHVAFSCHHSSASSKLEHFPVFPWLSWKSPWHRWVLPKILYEVICWSWLTLDHESWLFSFHKFCRQVEVMLKWPSWESSYYESLAWYETSYPCCLSCGLPPHFISDLILQVRLPRLLPNTKLSHPAQVWQPVLIEQYLRKIIQKICKGLRHIYHAYPVGRLPVALLVRLESIIVPL